LKYCPQCETEYLDHIETCADCTVPLIDEETFRSAEPPTDAGQRGNVELVMLCPVGDQVEAESILAALGAEGIGGYLRSFEETVYIGHTDAHQGFGEIWVPKKRAEQARVIVEELWCSPP
jgi:hypothetical protein